ncbi:DUF2339 domain-containing protein [Caulobacter sp. UNC279MFTsu5.1]|uniref:DUF2339 domain-containing protein n=1 Tax=Caulobacter sp. UNC279MFTsu5.1 TaxID=1502775 RepID=UPI0011601A4B|nr:DUF2339 domain-containing protein [Caulobacter sp. UNC279MFTsu5.1]
MTWLIIIGLAIWIFRQGQRLKTLEKQVRALATAPPAVSPPQAARGAPPEPRPAPEPRTAPRPEPQPEPEPARLRPSPLVEQILAGDDPKPEPLAPSPPPYRPARVAETAPAPSVVRPRPEPPPLAPRPPPRPSRPPPRVTWTAASTWLAENGLAWLGGGGLALGGLLLVVYAAQRGVFTPALRVACAAVLGLLMVAASEWIRRQKNAPGGRHGLAAAASAGAGAVTLYGAVWAACSLYGLIPLPLAAVLAVAVSAGLLALSWLHGEALALLALFGAFLAPYMTGGVVAWSPVALEAYLALLGATGAAVNALRRWPRAGVVTLAGLLIWTLAALLRRRDEDAAMLLALALAGPALAVLWRRRGANDLTLKAAGTDLFLRLPLGALVAVSLAASGLWVTSGHDPGLLATVFGGLLILAAATLAALGLVPAPAFAAPVGVMALGLLVGLRFHDGPGGSWLTWRAFTLVAMIAASGLAAGWRATAPVRTVLLAVAGLGAALLANLAWPLLETAAPAAPGRLVAGLTSLLLAAGAAALSRRVETPQRDVGLGLWIAAAAELLFLTVHASVPAHLEPAAQALVALLLAGAASRLAWRGLAATAVAGGLVALATMLRPGFVADASSGALSLPLLGGVTLVAALALLAASWIVGPRRTSKPGVDHRTEGEALSTAALLVLLTGVFLMLHAVLARMAPAAAQANPLLEASLRTALVLAAGLLLAARGRPDDGVIARWRQIVVTTVGTAYGLLTAGLILHPWWGLGDPPLGPPVLNDLILDFLAPALLLAATARRRADAKDGWTRSWIVAAAVFALLWAVTTVRHAFHGAALHDAPVGLAELCAYALLGLLAARAFLDRRLEGERTAWLHAAAPVAGWAALALASLVFALVANPWWGAYDAPPASWPHLALVFALYLGAAAAAFSLDRGGRALSRAALCVGVGLGFVLAMLGLRAAFHGLALNEAAVGRVELFAYALLALGTARAFLSRRLDRPRAAWLRAAAPVVGWIALGVTALVFGLVANPWWGMLDAPPTSPIHTAVVLTLYVAAAALAAGLKRGGETLARAALCVSAGLVLTFVLLVMRWVFHGTTIAADMVGPAEACAYALVGLATARAFRSPRLDAPDAAWLKAAAPAVGWTALAWAGLIFGWLASPWWGPFDGPTTSIWHVALILALYLAGAAATLLLRRNEPAFARTALCVAVGVLFAFVTLLTRFAFQGVDMRHGLDRGGLETWTFSAVWAVFGLVVLFRASARKDAALRWLGLVVVLATAAKVLLFDMATLDGVVRAASFLAVGALFIAGALVARRLNAGHKDKIDDPPVETQDDRSPAS